MSHIYKMLCAALFSSALFLGAVTHAATPKLVSGIPLNTFCSTYAKDVATKSVAIGLIVKIKDNPSQKAKLMRQYQSFVALGKQYCKDATYTSAST